MKRRNILKSMGLLGPAWLAGGGERAAERADAAGVAEMRMPSAPTVGSFDLSDIEIVDTHVHPPNPMTLSESY